MSGPARRWCVMDLVVDHKTGKLRESAVWSNVGQRCEHLRRILHLGKTETSFLDQHATDPRGHGIGQRSLQNIRALASQVLLERGLDAGNVGFLGQGLQHWHDFLAHGLICCTPLFRAPYNSQRRRGIGSWGTNLLE